jgi:hypothetical protein
MVFLPRGMRRRDTGLLTSAKGQKHWCFSSYRACALLLPPFWFVGNPEQYCSITFPVLLRDYVTQHHLHKFIQTVRHLIGGLG